MKGMVYVEPEGIGTDAELQGWLEQAVEFAEALPRKAATTKSHRPTKRK